jgi:pimeloyl-ACP methyl ester carboxylesterase
VSWPCSSSHQSLRADHRAAARNEDHGHDDLDPAPSAILILLQSHLQQSSAFVAITPGTDEQLIRGAKLKVVFLHGIGNGNPDFDWLDGLNRGLEQLQYPVLERDRVIAPRYSECLSRNGREGVKLPPLTYKPKNDADPRREFERRQARVQRLLQMQDGVRTYGFNLIPDPVVSTIPPHVIDRVPLMNLPQVRRYVRDDKVRADVMDRILDHLPTHGDIVLIGHSLGSVIAIDLLDHLPSDLRVRRFITIGSPAALRALHEGSDRLLKKFPYGRVDDWSNFFSVRDVVTAGRGLASTFPGAQDFELTSVHGHGADLYLSDPAVARLVADTLYPTKDVVPAGSNVAVRMSEAEASLMLLQHFAEAVARHIKDGERANRFRATLRLLRDDLGAQLQNCAAAGQLLAPEMVELMNGRLPRLPHRWEIHEVVSELVVLAFTNCVAPYEVDTGDAQIEALKDISVELGFTRTIGKMVGESIKDVQNFVFPKSGVPWGRVLTAAAGVALLAAGPVGLAVAAPAGAYGAAAIVGGLAAFGPGGMVGGLAMLGGLAGTGAAAAAAAAVGGGGSDATAPNLGKLMMRVAAEWARKRLDLPFDHTLWYQVTDFEGQISAVLNRLKAFNDPKSPTMVQLSTAQQAVASLLRFLIEKGLAPAELTDGEQRAITAADEPA